MRLHDIYAKLDAGEIDVEEAMRLIRLHSKSSWLDRILEALAG